MAERAPLSVTFYLSAEDAELFTALHQAHKGERYDEDAHEKLIQQGLLELDEFNRQPDGSCMNDVRLTSKGQRELGLLRAKAGEAFEHLRRTKRASGVPDSPARDRLTRSPVPIPGGKSSGARQPSCADRETVSSEAGFTQPSEGA